MRTTRTTQRTKVAALAAAFGIALALLSAPVVAHEQGAISHHSITDADIYFGYGPAWGTSFAAWNQARVNATNACVTDGNAGCNFSVAAWDHCTFWGEGEFVHGAPRGEPGFGTPRYLCISHPPAAVDDDNDGVNNDVDQCSDTPEGASVDGNGCSGAQNVAVAAPCDGDWKNHGAYVSAVSHAVEDQVAAGLLTEEEGEAIVSAAAQSDCGKGSNGRGRGKAAATSASWGEVKDSVR